MLLTPTESQARLPTTPRPAFPALTSLISPVSGVAWPCRQRYAMLIRIVPPDSRDTRAANPSSSPVLPLELASVSTTGWLACLPPALSKPEDPHPASITITASRTTGRTRTTIAPHSLPRQPGAPHAIRRSTGRPPGLTLEPRARSRGLALGQVRGAPGVAAGMRCLTSDPRCRQGRPLTSEGEEMKPLFQWWGIAMRGLTRRVVVVAGAAVVLLGLAVGMASAAGAAAGTRLAVGRDGSGGTWGAAKEAPGAATLNQRAAILPALTFAIPAQGRARYLPPAVGAFPAGAFAPPDPALAAAPAG